MLSKQNRMSAKKDFDRVWKQGRSVYGKHIGIKAAPNNLGRPRFGIVAGAKVSKRATRRNLIKRRLREALRREFVKLVPAVDVMVIVRPGSIGRTYVQIVDELLTLFGRAGLIKK